MTQNALVDVDKTWIGDGSSGILSVSLPELSIASEKGKPFNVMLNSVVSTNNFYFEIDITTLNGNVSVGVVKKEEFLPGYKVKGMFYNGNVTNGSAAKIVAFGDYVKEGSKIGVRVAHEPSGVLRTIFYVDGQCLGTAFEIEGLQTSDVFRPCIHVTGEVSIMYDAPPEVPQTTEREAPKHADEYLGDWKLEKLFVGPELHEFPLPSNHEILLNFRQGNTENTYDFSVKVGNTLGSQVLVEQKDGNFDMIKVGPARSTMMIPPPDLQPVESTISESLPKVFKMIVSENLIMTGADVELIAHRFLKTFAPLDKY